MKPIIRSGEYILLLLLCCACLPALAQQTLITTIAGNDSAGYCCDGNPAISALLNHPDQLCLDNFGNLYIADPGNNRIRKIVLSTGIITTVAGNGIAGYFGDNGLATDAQLFIPEGICADTFGNIYISDALNNRIRKVIVSTGIITTFAGNGSPGNSGDGGIATNAQVMTPEGLSMDKFGNLYIADIDNNNVRKVDASTGIIKTIAGIGTSGYTGDEGPATSAQLNSPGKAIVDNYGNIIISDSYNQAIRKIDGTTGVITTIAGNGTPGYFGDGGQATNALLGGPFGLYIDKENDIYIAEHGNGIIRKINYSTGIISTVVGCGIPGFSGDNGPATNAKLEPDDMYMSSDGIMYIADYGNNRIRKVYNSTLAIKLLIPKMKVLIYPNPTKNELNIENANNTELRIYNVIGENVKRIKCKSDKETVDISNLINGLYIVQVTDNEDNKKSIKLVKE